MQRVRGRRVIFAVFAFVLAGCLAPPPQDHSGDASGSSPDVTTESDATTGSSDVADAGPLEDAIVHAPATIDAPNDVADGSACGPANTSGKCVCDSTSCSGCCDDAGACQTSSIATCGINAAACVACAFGNAAASCNSGSCALSTCNSGFANCDGVASNGCETNVKGTDANNCGACHHSCLTGGSCSGGVCQPIPFVNSGTSNIVDLDTNGTLVVFADSGKLQIAEVDIPGGTPQVLAGNGQVTNPDHVAIDPSSAAIYWTDSGNYGTATAGQIGSGSIQGSACGASKVNAVANPTTNALDVLSTNLGTLLVGTGCVADTTTGISANLGASLSPRWVFGDLGAGVVVFGGAQGPPSATIASQPGANWVADDKTYGYWATTEPAIRRAPFNAPSSVSVVLASPGGAVGGLATDGTYVYYGTSSGIFYVPVGGAPSGTLLTYKPGTHLRYASKALFFLAGGVIYKIATPP
jgi:hypothetical protein